MRVRSLAAALVFVGSSLGAEAVLADGWTTDELTTLRSLWIGSLPRLPPDPSNRYGDDPRAAEFGHRLFFDARLSANGKVACASCHVPSLAFTDGRATSTGIGSTTRNAPTLVGAAFSPWLFWDGRKDSLWSQALAPLESPVEHGMTRTRIVETIRGDQDYRGRYTALFGSLPTAGDAAETTRAFANIGKAIAAYGRMLRPGPSKFDRWVAALLEGAEPAPADRLTLDEEEGLRALIDDTRGKCLRCHNGPLFTDNRFHNIGIDEGDPLGPPVTDAEGRPAGFRTVLADEFGCLARFSDAPPDACFDVKAASDDSHRPGAFRTPTLRNLGRTAPYMRDGRFATLDAVMQHYRERPHARLGRNELEFLTITDTEFRQIEAFLGTLDGPVDAPARYLRPPDRE